MRTEKSLDTSEDTVGHVELVGNKASARPIIRSRVEPASEAATPPTVREMVDPVVREHYPALVETVHACLAVFGSMALAGRTKPVSLILETASGYGKSAALQCSSLSPGTEHWRECVSTFTEVTSSHRSHSSATLRMLKAMTHDLAGIDLLPKLKNRFS